MDKQLLRTNGRRSETNLQIRPDTLTKLRLKRSLTEPPPAALGIVGRTVGGRRSSAAQWFGSVSVGRAERASGGGGQCR